MRESLHPLLFQSSSEVGGGVRMERNAFSDGHAGHARIIWRKDKRSSHWHLGGAVFFYK